jgi:hypothetical protein
MAVDEVKSGGFTGEVNYYLYQENQIRVLTRRLFFKSVVSPLIVGDNFPLEAACLAPFCQSQYSLRTLI